MNKLGRRLIAALCLGILVTFLARIGIAQPPDLDFPVGTTVTLRDPLPERVVELADATVLTDVVYSTVPGYRPMRLDLYRAKPVNKMAVQPRPLVVFVHGGGWVIGNKRSTGAFSDFPGVLAALAKRGYVVASLEYRLGGEAPFPAALQDIKAGLRFLRANASRYGINPQKVVLWGSSAGAHLASLAAYTCDLPAFAPTDKSYANSSDCVQGFVGWYGPYDLTALVQAALGSSSGNIPMNNPEIAGAAKFFSCTLVGCPPETLTQASSTTHISRQDPPTLLIHGAADTLVPITQSELLATKLRAVGVPVEMIVIPGVDHDFRGQTQTSTRAASLQALSATFAFFDKAK